MLCIRAAALLHCIGEFRVRMSPHPVFAPLQDFQKAAEEVQGEAHAAEQGLHRYGALLSQLPPTVRGTSPYRTPPCAAPAAAAFRSPSELSWR